MNGKKAKKLRKAVWEGEDEERRYYRTKKRQRYADPKRRTYQKLKEVKG